MIPDEIPLGRVERAVAECLARNLGKWVATERLVAAAYENDPNGGPVGASDSVKQNGALPS